ncbi:hypothetical protein CPY51_28170 [Rhizobium tubonense]|uniref:Uncharacterized protein n=1 Tax=Rhizobium tubonense TaxID=484088 RepID=A0A2W4E9E0_9HYPH|nr:hypothetical protein CPY51_28170 [Rhizobium tubonense]
MINAFDFGSFLSWRALAPGLSFADNERSFGLVDRLPGEDPSCDAVNRAYEKTSNLARYTIYVAELKPDGTIAPFGEDWIETQMNISLWQPTRTSSIVGPSV